jgi:hypothetical protein
MYSLHSKCAVSSKILHWGTEVDVIILKIVLPKKRRKS